MYRQRQDSRSKSGIMWTYYCNHYLTVSMNLADNFLPGKFTKIGAVNENVKGRREDGNTSFKCMVNPKMK